TTYQPSERLVAQLGLARRDIGEKNFYYGKGCDACNQTGYKGRKGIYELMKITDPLRELINERAPSVTLKAKAIELGMVTLRQDGLRSIFAGDAAAAKTKGRKVKAPPAERKARSKNIVLFQRKSVKPKVLMIFTRQLATLIDAGLPLLRGLNVLAKQEKDSVLKNTINKLADSVQGGSTFSEGLAQHPRIFNDLFVNMVKA